MTREKRNKPRFWCHDCRLIGYRALELIQERAKQHGKEVWECPHQSGFHFGDRKPG